MTTAFAVFLGLAALGSLVQAVAFIVVFVEIRRAFVRVDALGRRSAVELVPALAHLVQASDSMVKATSVTVAQTRRVDALLAETGATVAETAATLRRVIVPSARRVTTLTAAFRTAQKGLALYRSFKS